MPENPVDSIISGQICLIISGYATERRYTMRGKKAKKIRRKIYGDFSHKTRSYATVGSTVINTGKRAEYLKAKKVT